MYELLGGRIKALRTEKNDTQRQGAEQLGISRQKYACLENGDRRVSLDILTRSARTLDVTVSDITSVLEEEPGTLDHSEVNGFSSKKIFDMLALFYANKHMYTRLRRRNMA